MRVIFFFLLLITLAGCKNKDKVPSGVLSAEEMVPVLVDLHLYEAVNGRIDLFKDSIPQQMIDIYTSILAKNEISEEKLVSSYSYYAEKNPQQLISIYDTVLVRLGDLESESFEGEAQPPTYPEQDLDKLEKLDISNTFTEDSDQDESTDEMENGDSLTPKPERKKILKNDQAPNQ